MGTFPWMLIVEIIVEVLKLIMGNGKLTEADRLQYMQRWRVAKHVALTTGDTSDLEKLESELLAHR